MSRPGEGNGTSTVTGRICMEAHMLNDVETRKILFIWNDVEFTGSVSGKSQGRLKRSGDLPHASGAGDFFPCQAGWKCCINVYGKRTMGCVPKGS